MTLIACLPQAPLSARRVAEGEHFRIECHFDHHPSAEQALAAAEAVWPITTELYTESERNAGQPATSEAGLGRLVSQPLLVLHLYRDAEAYLIAENELTGGLFRRNLAFAHLASRTAHVAVQPPLSDAALERIGLPEQTLRLVAHEAAHLARYARMPNHALHPEWFVDGNASFVDQEALEALGLSPGLERDPWSSHEILLLQRLLAADRLPTARLVFRNTLDEISFYERYALRHLFFRYLWEEGHRHDLERIRAIFARLQRGSDTPLELAQAIHGVLAGSGGMDALDEPFRRYLAGLEPHWDEVHRSLAARDGGWLQIAYPDDDATVWSTRAAQVSSYRLRGSFEFLAGEEPQLNLHFARSESGFLSLALAAGHAPALYRFSAVDSSWKHIGSAGPKLPRGRHVAFELALSPGRVSLDIDAVTALALELEEDEPSGAWGLAAHSGTAGRWAGLELMSAAGGKTTGR